MQTILQDLRFAIRQLRRAPGFALTVVLMLALGIGATAAIFTLDYDVMLKPLPYRHAEQIVMLEEQVAEFRDIYPTLPINANHFVMWQQNTRTLHSIAVMRDMSLPLGLGGHPMQVHVVQSTPGIFSVLDIAPQLGRSFTTDEAQPGHDRVVVLSYDMWRTQFQSDPNILGRTVTLNGFPYSVIGVMPQSFHLPLVNNIAGSSQNRQMPIEALTPLAFSKDELQEAMGDFNYFGLARLKPGVSVDQAAADINALQRIIASRLATDEKGTLSAVVTPYQQAIVGNNRTSLLVLLAAVAGLLLVGCVNITNLLLSRAVDRRQQMAVTAALGASQRQLMRIAMREPALLAAVGGALGILVGATLVPILQHFLPAALDFRGPLHLDGMGAALALVLAIVATLLAGAIPGWISSRTHPLEVLRSESRLASEARGTKQLRRLLVAAEVAVSVALVLISSLLTSSLIRLMHVDRGFTADRVLTVQVNLPNKSYSERPARTAFFRQALDRLHQLPGLEEAGLVSQPPLAGDQWIDMIRVAGDTRPFMQLPTEHFRFISPGYIEALHLSLLAGRTLTPGDDGKNYALVSELTARTFWPGKNPIGQQFARGGDGDKQRFTVIGVVKDARTVSLAQTDPMMVYTPYWYRCEETASLILRTRQDPETMADAVRRAIWSVDPDASVPAIRTLDGVVAESVTARRFEMNLLLTFAVSALLLAGLGVYGVITYTVAQRHHEIGLRMALGAGQANIYRLVFREGLEPVIIGLIVGIGLSFGFARAIGSLLFQVSPFNPMLVCVSVCTILAVGVTACLLPARRAAAVEPMQALRSE
jgi:predicted permease